MFRPLIFANTIFSQRFNLRSLLDPFSGFGFCFPFLCLWACDRHLGVGGGALCTLLVLGGVASPLFGVGK